MGQDYSYTQPSESADYGLGDSDDSGYSTTEHAIMMDQAELQATSIVYPPQPEVDFGFPKECYCGGEPLLATSYSRNDPGRRFYTCGNRDDGDMHLYRWWDVAATEEIRDLRAQYALLSDKVDALSLHTQYETQLQEVMDVHGEIDQKLVRLDRIVDGLAKKRTRFGNGYELVLALLVGVVVIISVIVAARGC
ncbi:hypothetical protein Bca4012_027216 [Brassica carinata]